MRRLWMAAVGCAVLAVAVWAGAAQARIDRGYGENGVVAVQPPLPSPWQEQNVVRLAAAPDGSAYAVLARKHCEYRGWPCSASFAVVRYDSHGSLDPSFGGAGYYEIPAETPWVPDPALAVDSAGRPVIAQNVKGQISVVRLTTGGEPDLSFGNAGVVSFSCDCEGGEGRFGEGQKLIKGPRGSLTLVVGTRSVSGNRGKDAQSGTVVDLVRLRGNGSFDKRFGTAGSVTVGLPNTEPFTAAATAKGGALYLAGAGCCKSSRRGYLVRISAKGRYDRRFARASGRALSAVRRFGSLGQSVHAILLRSHGRIDLLGSAGYDRGFMLRLNGRGESVRTFARKGLRGLPLPIDAAVHGSHGATLMLSDTNARGVGVLMRMRSEGRMDRGFGRETIPDSEGRTGISIASQGRRGALVLSLGLKECREYCPPQAQLIRYAE